MLFDILLMSKRVDLYVGEIAAAFTPNTVKFIVTVGQADSVWASMKMVIMVLGVWCGGVGRIIGTVVLLPGTVIGVLGSVIGVLGTVFRKLKIGLFIARDGHRSCKGDSRTALFTLLSFCLLLFAP